MIRWLLIIGLLSQTALQAGIDAGALDLLAARADEATKGIIPQLIFAHEDAKAFAQAVLADVKDNQAAEVIRLLRRYEYASPSWQITAKTVSYNPYGGAAPTPEGRRTLERIFAAAIKPGEHWLYYSPPRGWTSPFWLRKHLASWMTQNVYQTSDMVDKDLLREDPAAWLAKHGVYQKGKESVPAPVGTSPPHVETVPSASQTVVPPATQAGPSSAVPASGPSAATSSTSDEGMPGRPFWLAAVGAILAVLAWLAWKKDRRA